ncbi:MAG: DUF6279 family lipoprotein [Gammaproteobacteria bacterium]|nr:DUF6279 family lipoprotein [Gammaproteobacteria bacterium]
MSIRHCNLAFTPAVWGCVTARTGPGMAAAGIRSAHRWFGARGLAIGILIAATLSGCSTVRVAYPQLDWLIANRIDGYVRLTHEQRKVVNDHIDAILAWHCRTQLGDYATWLRRVRSDFSHGITAAELDDHIAALEDGWRTLMQRLVPVGVEVLSTLRDDQVAQFLGSIEENNGAYRKQYVESAESTWRRTNRTWMEKAVRRGLGELTRDQQHAISAWVNAIVPTREIGWAERMRWQQAFRSLLDRRHDRQALADGLTRLLVYWDYHRGETYRRIHAHNRDQLAALLISISRTATPRQKRYLKSRIEGYARDFDALACGSGPA